MTSVTPASRPVAFPTRTRDTRSPVLRAVAQNADHFDAFDPHTRLKHAILRAYLSRWAFKLLQSGYGAGLVYFVDAFAGAGQDETGNPGSPLIAAQIAAGVPAGLPTGRRGEMRVRAIEQKAKRHKALAALLAPFQRLNPDLVRADRGELADHLEALAVEIGQAPALYFLDPFGLKGLDAAMYPRLLAGPQNEVFALFADMGATRVHGLVTAERGDVEGQIARLRERPSLFEEIDAEREEAVRAAADRRNRALDASQGASREHVVRALGDPGVFEAIEQLPSAERAAGFLEAFIRAMVRAGARDVLTIPMRNAEGQRVYALVHASKSAKGFAAMKESVSEGLNREDLPAEMRDRIREDLSVPLDDVMRDLRTRFAGQVDVPWTGDTGSVQCYLLEQTSVFRFQLNAVRDALMAAGILRRAARGKMLCTFAPAQAA